MSRIPIIELYEESQESLEKNPTPQKSKIPKIAILKGSRYLFQGPSFWGPPAVSFRECTNSLNLNTSDRSILLYDTSREKSQESTLITRCCFHSPNSQGCPSRGSP